MNTSHLRARLVATVLLFYAGWATAEDAIAIRYLGGRSIPDRSAEGMNVRIVRTTSVSVLADEKKVGVDRFFDRLAAVLAENRIDSDWQLVIPDAPSIEITIDLNGKKIKLASSHTLLEQRSSYLVTEQGAQIVTEKSRGPTLAGQSESFRQRRHAFETILQLTVEETGARLSPRR